jgi:hypothetical protein
MTPEGKLKADLKAFLKEQGAYFFMPVQCGFGKRSVDFICCLKGRFVAIETKIWPRKSTPLQRLCLEEVRKAGGIAFVAYDMDTVYANLRELTT